MLRGDTDSRWCYTLPAQHTQGCWQPIQWRKAMAHLFERCIRPTFSEAQARCVKAGGVLAVYVIYKLKLCSGYGFPCMDPGRTTRISTFS